MNRIVPVLGLLIAGLLVSGNASARIVGEAQWKTGIHKEGVDLATSSDGTVFMLGIKSGRVTHLSAAGDRIGGWKVKADSPSAIATDPDGNVLVGSDSRVERFASTGKRLKTWRLAHDLGDGFLESSVDSIAVADSGEVYLVDGLNFQVLRLSAKGRYLGYFGGIGAKHLYLPSDIAVGPDGRLYVTEVVGRQVQVFGPKGKFIESWGRKGLGPGEFITAEGVATDDQGRVYVGDGLASRIQVFDADGKYLDQIGSGGTGPGRFSSVNSIAAEADGRFFVADRGGTRIQPFQFSDGPHVPQAQLYFTSKTFVVNGLPGKRVTIRLVVANFGDLTANDINVCPDRKRWFSRKMLRGVACLRVGSLEPGGTRKLTIKTRVPPKMKKNGFDFVVFRQSSSNAGGDGTPVFVYAGKHFGGFGPED